MIHTKVPSSLQSEPTTKENKQTRTHMKKLFSLLAIFVMALGVNAQNDALNNLRRDVATSPIPASMLAAGAEQVIFGAHVRDDRPAVSPRNPSPPASAHRPAANNGGAKALKIDTLPGGIIKGPDFMLYPDGSSYLLQGGQWVQVAKAAPAPTQAQPAPVTIPGNTGGVATAQGGDVVIPPQFGLHGEVLVYNPNTKTWDIPEGMKQAMAAQAQAGQAKTTTGGGGEDRPETISMRRNDVLVNRRGDGQLELLLEERARERVKAVRLYDLAENAPTSGSARAVEARNGIVSGGGMVGVGVGVGVGVPVYQQRTYGPVGYAQWQANQWWNKPCRTCR